MRSLTVRAEHFISLVALGGALALSVACGGSSSAHSNAQNTVTTSGSNVQSITVNAGPAGNYANGAFTSVTLCVPGTSTCQTIDGILVDTGSSGLRVLSSALSQTLPQETASDGNAMVECLPFVSGYTWGPVQMADVEIASEKASSAAVQVISDSAYPVPAKCQANGSSSDSLQTLGANGILGVGEFAQDCGGYCVQADNPAGTAAPAIYFECPSSGCVPAWATLAQQVVNPVILFTTDNNGVIVELPAASTPEASLTGSLVFGIGTQSNNSLNGSTTYTVDDFGNFTTVYNNQSYDESFLDSGSNGIFFLTDSATGIPPCPGMTYFYCPTTTENLSATNQGVNGSSGQISFSVANADTLLNDNPSATVLDQLAGPNSLSGFDWGLPFFYGRNVYTAIEGQSTPAGTGPYWAY